MLIAYLTTDEVNRHLATEMADECGMTVYPLTFAEMPPSDGFDAVLVDWDCLVSYRREEILKDTLAASPSCPLAVHGYGLEKDEADSWRQDGVAVFEHLDPELFETVRALWKARPWSAPDEPPRRRRTGHSGYRLVLRPAREIRARTPELPGGVKRPVPSDCPRAGGCQPARAGPFAVVPVWTEESPWCRDVVLAN